MKKKVMSVFFQLAWAALLVISLLYPRSGAPVLVGASVWVSCFLAWLLAALLPMQPSDSDAGCHCWLRHTKSAHAENNCCCY